MAPDALFHGWQSRKYEEHMEHLNKRTKMTLLPLRWASHDLLAVGESIDLGFGVSVERCRELLASADLWIWNHKGIKDDADELNTWDICLVHRYEAEPITGPSDEDSVTLLAYVLAHLRLINPHRDSVDDHIQLQLAQADGKVSAFRCTKASLRPNRLLCDCENLIVGIERAELDRLRTMMRWIIHFAKNWRAYHPLWLSIYLIEEGYKVGHNLRTLHLFRVMALEALFCSESSFGKKALTRRIPRLLGDGIDLYAGYGVDYFELPKLPLTKDLIKNVYTLRNKIAHSDILPADWVSTIVRQGLNEGITYSGELLEAATSMARLSWLKIINEGLQDTFSNKRTMQAFLP